MRIVRDENWKSAWLPALEFLERFDDDEVLTLFWDLVLRDDILHKEVNRLVDRYIKRHAKKYE